MAKPNYSFEKRQRDLAKKSKQEEKRQRKLTSKATDEDGGPIREAGIHRRRAYKDSGLKLLGATQSLLTEEGDAASYSGHPDTRGTGAHPPAVAFNKSGRSMNDEKIEIRVTSSGQRLQVVVLNKALDKIDIVLGEGVHSVRCTLAPARNGAMYVGNAMGREIVYERSREQVKADLARAAGFQEFRR